MKRIGRAHAFFACQVPKQRIESELPRLREFAGIPPKLELSLIQGPRNIKGNITIVAIAKAAEEAGMDYALEASCPARNNRQTADALLSILKQLSEVLPFGEIDRFLSQVVFRVDDKYIFKSYPKHDGS